VLAGIVDLERFEKLHQRADEQRKRLKAQTETLQTQLDNLPEVTELELVEAAGRIEDARAALEQGQAQVEKWQRLEVQAERWAELQAKLAEARQTWDRARKLLADAEVIQQPW